MVLFRMILALMILIAPHILDSSSERTIYPREKVAHFIGQLEQISELHASYQAQKPGHFSEACILGFWNGQQYERLT